MLSATKAKIAVAKERLVVFCGAGFSKCAGIPLMDEFAETLRDGDHLDTADQYEFDAIQRTCNDLGSYIQESARNLEHLSSFLDVLQMSNPRFLFEGCKKYKTPELASAFVKECIRRVTHPPLASVQARHANNLCKLATSVHLSVITTNYDLHLELGSLDLDSKVRARPTPSILACTTASCGDSLYWTDPETSFDIFKLHGSVNWYSDDDGLAVHGLIHEVPQSKANSLAHRIILETGGNVTPHDPSTCLLSPPSVIKPRIEPLLKDQWEGAANALMQADRLWFIGYSFPQSDSFMRYFLASTLCRNVRLKQIVIIDKNLATIRERAMPLLESPQHRGRVYAMPGLWHRVDLNGLLLDDLDQAAQFIATGTGYVSYVDLLESALDEEKTLARHRGQSGS